MTKLVALIDASVYSQSVCDHAAWIASRIDASIEIVHVLGRRDVPNEDSNLSGAIGFDASSTLLEELAENDMQRAKLARARGRALLDAAKARVLQTGPIETVARLRNGEIVESVQDLEQDADLIVIGKRGEAADFDKLHLGSNLERVVRSSHKPVLVASREFKSIESFLIAFDGGPSATRAVEHVANFHMFADLDCKLLNVGKPSTKTTDSLARAAARLRESGYRVETELRPGQPEEVIAEMVEADGLDLLVMGAYGHSRIRNLIIGSTTTQMIRSCMSPVLLFR